MPSGFVAVSSFLELRVAHRLAWSPRITEVPPLLAALSERQRCDGKTRNSRGYRSGATDSRGRPRPDTRRLTRLLRRKAGPAPEDEQCNCNSCETVGSSKAAWSHGYCRRSRSHHFSKTKTHLPQTTRHRRPTPREKRDGASRISATKPRTTQRRLLIRKLDLRNAAPGRRLPGLAAAEGRVGSYLGRHPPARAWEPGLVATQRRIPAARPATKRKLATARNRAGQTAASGLQRAAQIPETPELRDPVAGPRATAAART